MTRFYSAYGLTLRTPFICDGLIEADSTSTADVEVAEGIVPRELPNPAVRDATHDVVPGRYLFRGGQRSARFLVEAGARVTFQRNGDCQDDLFQHHFLHPVMAAILRQRELLVLHASSAVNDANAVVLGGASGIGKSTTLAGLAARGWKMLSDDIVALRLNGRGRLEVLPGAIRVHLHEDAAAVLRFDTTGLPRPDWHRRKMALPMNGPVGVPPCILNKLVHLAPAADVSGLRMRRVSGREKLRLLLGAVYGPLLPDEIAARADLFAAALLDVQVVCVARPHGAWTLDEIVGMIADG